jgi:dihydrodipicolinate synthase/N-acetylneuraminate lyase
MYDLTREERLSISRHVVNTVKGRIPVVASGNFDASVDDQAKFVREIYNTGVQVLKPYITFNRLSLLLSARSARQLTRKLYFEKK